MRKKNGKEVQTDLSSLRVLIVDDEDDFRESACRYLARIGFQVDEAQDGEEALNLTVNRRFDVVILDMHMPVLDGLSVLKELMKRDPPPKVIMLTGGGTIENAVEAIKLGSYDFLTKPAKLDELAHIICRACEAQQLEKENKQLKEVIRRQAPTSQLIGQSAAMEEVNRLMERIADSEQPVLIQGESGTGKELVARAIHLSSPLADKPLVVVNCAALADQLLESELFGHEKGAFTGAVAAKPGLFEVADGGTMFIDEFGEMSGALQAKLLRVLEDGSMRRVGSVTERFVSVRVLAATNRDLEEEVKERNFREDLYYRINVLGITIPPLRQRHGDIELLAKQFAGSDWTIATEVLEKLNHYSWPGNVRQLQNAIQRAKVLAEDNEIQLNNLPNAIVDLNLPLAEIPTNSSASDLDTINKMHVVKTYESCGQNKTKAARALGINRRSLYRLLEKYDLE
ncbi:sigma-54 dependent transcriptional regulator [Pirellulaceae bacterium]|nr:sigma-54 dependent transcriptional regulator [Pirellulaceae bacterium]